MTTYEKIVKGATKVKVAAPKLKYIEPILLATLVHQYTEVENFNTIMRTLRQRLQDSAWSVVYKSLIVIHIMIREGDRDFTLDYIGDKMPGLLNIDQSSVARNSGMTSDVKFTLKYAKYLQTRVKQFQITGIDYVRDERSNNSTDQAGGRLRHLSVEKGLLRECESVQRQIDALLKNNFLENDVKNDVLLTAFRLLVNDLLSLFQELNEGVINLLEHYFEMSKVDAERALEIYKHFVDQTKYVIDYLRVAKHLEFATKLHVPTIKHAPTALTSSLEEYLDDPNFETNRRQYLYEKQLKNGKSSPSKVDSLLQKQQQSESQSNVQPQASQAQMQDPNQNGNLQRANSLVIQQSSFNPWEQQINQGFTGMAPQQVYHTGGVFTMPSIPQGQAVQGQQTGQLPQRPQQQPQQQPQPLQHPQLTTVPTGTGFGGYGAQPQVQPQSTGTNPFLQNSSTGNPYQPNHQYNGQLQQQNTQQFNQPVQPQMTQQTQQMQPQLSQQNTQFGLQRSNTNPFSSMTGNGRALSTNSTGSTNPFANTRFALGSNTTALSFNNASSSQQKQEPLKASSTGSNPFKVSETTTNLFNNVESNNQKQQALRPQVTAGGLEHLPTISVFPQTQQEQQKQQYLNNAQMGLHQQMTGSNPQYQQQAPSQMQQPQMQPQSTQQYLQGQQPFNQQFPQQMQPQQTQPFGVPSANQNNQPIFANNTYDGPSLI